MSLRKLVGDPRAKTLTRRLNEGAKAFEAERFGDARTQLTPIVKEAPELPEGRELMGLTLYRLGKWKEAIEHLESFRDLSGSTEQHPVLADCHRALEHWADVDVLWEELGDASPSAELVVEGRIVVAGAKADQGDLTSAIRLLEQNWRPPKRPQPHHLRRAYALADLYDRAGRAPRARELFSWVAGHAPDLADVRARVKALG
ncbi:MAG: tetratricopeptide repeat protein [Actinomycetota bacterium]